MSETPPNDVGQMLRLLAESGVTAEYVDISLAELSALFVSGEIAEAIVFLTPDSNNSNCVFVQEFEITATDATVVFADPANGRSWRVSQADFEQEYSGKAIVTAPAAAK